MKQMPVLFVGHGPPMNAIEDNPFSRQWEKLGEALPRPEAILSISAHWYTAGLRVTDDPAPRMVYDMYGFPDELYQVDYHPQGSPRFAALTRELIGGGVKIDNTWGLDHGSWSVLRRMFPKAEIPVFQMSVDRLAPPKGWYETGRALRTLREQGVLIFGSGNVVHNLGRVDWSMDGGYPWAEEFDGYIKKGILNRRAEDVIGYESAGEAARLAVPRPDHFAPLLYVLGASREEDTVTVSNEACVLGGLSMTSYLFA